MSVLRRIIIRFYWFVSAGEMQYSYELEIRGKLSKRTGRKVLYPFNTIIFCLH